MTERPRKSRLYFKVANVNYPCVYEAAMSADGERLELLDGGPNPDPPLILLSWRFSSSPPDFIWAASMRVFVSSRVLLRWQLQASTAVTLVPVHLVGTRRRVVAKDYWWVNIREEHAIMNRSRSDFESCGPAILRVSRFVVDWSKVPDLDLFICRDVYTAVFSESLARAATKSGFSGAYFREVDGHLWPPR